MQKNTPGKSLDTLQVSPETNFPKHNAILSILKITPEVLTMYAIPGVDQNISVRLLERYADCDKKIDSTTLENFDIKPYIRGLLQSPHKKDQRLGIDLLVNLDDTTYLSAESLVLKSPYFDVHNLCFFYIYQKNIGGKSCRLDELNSDLLQKTLHSELEDDQLVGIKLISSREGKKTREHFNIALHSSFPKVVLRILDKFNGTNYIEEPGVRNYILKLVKQLLNNNQSKENQIIGAKLIQYVPKKMMPKLLVTALQMPYPDIRDICLSTRRKLDDKNSEMIKNILSDKARKLLNTKNVSEQLLGSNYVNFLDNDHAQAVWKEVFIAVGLMPQDTAHDSLKLYPEVVLNLLVKGDLFECMHGDYKEVGLAYIQSPLYKKDFVKKGGAELSVHQNELRGKTIVRHFPPAQFLAWKKLYEDHVLRKEHGFDYVPIEPIQAFYQRSSGLVDVYAGVLDCNLHTRVNELNNGLWNRELMDDLKKIQDTFKTIGFSHGHTGGNPGAHNCVLRFWRKEDGSVDFKKKPRIYVIDFDQAKWINTPTELGESG